MDYPLRDYHLRPSSRRSSPSRSRRNYLHGGDGSFKYTNLQPSSGRSTPSAAVKRALQVLDESYRHQDENKRNNNCDRISTYRMNRAHSPSKSRTPSPVRKFLRDSYSPTPAPTTPPRILEIERDNLQDALGDSESRRNVLLRKLAETQRTMEIQNDTVKKGEVELRETKAASKLLQQVQEELETKVKYLEKERNSHLNRQLHDAEEKETLRREADNFHHEMKRLECQLDLMDTDKEERQRELNHAREEIRNMQENNHTLLENKSALCDELSTLKEHLSVAKQRIELLEKEKNHAQDDVSNLRESQQAIINRNTELSNRLNTAEDSVIQLRNKLDETEISLQTCKHDSETYKEKCAKQGYKLAELQTTYRDVQSDMDRSNRYITELERTLQSVKDGNQQLKENKITLEDNLTTLHAELAKCRLEYSRTTEEKNRYCDELELVKKGQRDLTNSLAEVRHQLSSREEELSQCQVKHKIDSQRLGLLETQNIQGERERDELASRLITLQESHENLKIQTEQNSQHSSQQLRELKAERDRLETKYKESEARSERLNLELAATVEHDQSQLDHWRETCTKLTSLMEQRDQDQREISAKLRNIEDVAERLESENKSLENQVSIMQELQHEIAEIKAENKRLVQEIKENQQMIAVLEMERDVLTKSPTKSGNDDFLGAEVKKLQSQLKIAVDKLTSVNSFKEKLAKEEDNIRIQAEEASEFDLKRAQEKNKLLADQLGQVKKEADTLQNLLEARTDTHEREIKKMEREKERLESRIRSLEDEAKVLRSSLTSSARSPTQSADVLDLRNLRVEVSRLKTELEDKEKSYLVTKGQLVVAQNAKKTAEDRVVIMSSQLEIMEKSTKTSSSRFSDNLENVQRELETKKARLEGVEAECTILKSRIEELSEVRAKHENLIKNLRQQLKNLKEKAVRGDIDGNQSDDNERIALIELASARHDLQRALEDIASRDHQLSELRRNLVSAQRQEQKARKERDELKGKTIIMESMTDSNTDLRKDMDRLRKEKSALEKQLNAFVKSKPSQTPVSSLSLSGEFDKEMERQYKIVCERNKWLENRISSLLREIDLLRDQNSLLLQEKNEAERQSEAIEGELKNVTILSKSNRQQKELEQIHLENSNAEKMQQIVELQREIRDKNQLIQALSKEFESSQKKTDKKKISSFMKKLRKSGESRSVTSLPERGQMMHASATEPLLGTFGSTGGLTLLPSTFSTRTSTDPGYSTLNIPNEGSKEKQSNRHRSRSSPGNISNMLHATQQSEFEEPRPKWKSHHKLYDESPEQPRTMKGLSPSPTLTTARRSARNIDDGLMESVSDYISDTGEPLVSPERHTFGDTQPLPEPPRKRLLKDDEMTESSVDEDSSEKEHSQHAFAGSSTQFPKVTERKRSYSSDRPAVSARSHDKRVAMSADELDERFVDSGIQKSKSSKKQSRRSSSDPVPEVYAPNPLPIPILPTPASSPSVLSPTSARNRAVQICVIGPDTSDDNQSHQQIDLTDSPSPNRPTSSPKSSDLPSPIATSGTPTKSKSSKTLFSDLI
uniref:girdin-like isoform X1 n=1 Tax=Styela clava TaxID=7725 RepID=UPI0019399D3F|nr:girdin-like isoform X1 [Styela clava]